MRKSNRKCILIFGKVGSGKSTLNNEVLKKFKGKINIIILDAMEEIEAKEYYTSFPQLANAYDYKQNDNIYVCRFESDQDVISLFKFCWIVRNVLLNIDEAERYISDVNAFEDFKQLINYGRHRRVSLVCIARRFVELPADLRSQYTSLFCLQQMEAIDYDRAKKIGFTDEQIEAIKVKKFLWGKNSIHDCYETLGETFEQIDKNL
jgi:hypothetical protein